MLAPYGVDFASMLEKSHAQGQQKGGKKYLSVREVEEMYGLKRWSLYRRIKSGEIHAVKTAKTRSGKVLVELESLEKYFNNLNYKGDL